MLPLEGIEKMELGRNLTINSSGSRAVGSGRSWFGGWSRLVVCSVVIVSAVLVFGGRLGGTLDAGKLLPLLYVLPCAIMMFMCMKNMGGNQGGAGGSKPVSGAPEAGADDGR